MITGVWKGKINKQKVEVKIIQQGDSLTGTSYYYESNTKYRRYAIKGFFDAQTNEAVWWDDYLIEEPGKGPAGKTPLLSRADFNCPGGAKMMLDGKSSIPQTQQPSGDVHLDKTGGTSFPDEWDFVIDNFMVGGNDPDIIDSVGMISMAQAPPAPTLPQKGREVVPSIVIEQPTPSPAVPQSGRETIIPVPAPLTIEEKFSTRKKTFVMEIPVTGDSIELRFYDNAEIDGDSISLFLNNNLLFQHVRLTGSAYSIKIAVGQLNEVNELIMVAENLGSIPPNTSYMVAIVGEKRYEANLESTEGSSAMIRFVKKRE